MHANPDPMLRESPVPPITPPPPSRPLDWRRARRLVRVLMDDPERTELVFELMDALGGRGDEPLFQEFASSRAGQRLLRERPPLVAALADREALRALPDGSLGRAYLAFAEARAFAADGLQQANDRGLGAVNAALDPERRYFYQRLTAMHDLWHVLTGYGTDESGEVALLAFSLAQGIAGRGVRVILLAAAWRGPRAGAFAFQRQLVAAWRRGRRCERLALLRYEELLPRPLASLRRELRLPSLYDAHPGGLVRLAAGFARARASGV
jgi:ubiquinone biosynthesis protein COQ4